MTGQLDEAVFDNALGEMAATATYRDAHPGFPSDSFGSLEKASALYFTFPSNDSREVDYASEWYAVRAVSRSDASVGRIFDGHLNGVERLALLASSELDSARSSTLILGVWGSDPHPDEGRPALLARRNGGFVVSGSKTFCSGAGGVDLALVMVRTEEGGPPALVLVDPRASTVIDRDWFKGSGLRSSESHLVTFDKTPVIEVLGGPGELSRAPWFARDAIRTAASWAGMADLAALRVLELLERRSDEDVACLAAGRIVSYRTRIDLWLSRAAAIARSELDGPSPEFSVQLRAEISSAARAILDEGARACGSHPFATGDPLDRARRDLDLFLLQHRLDPMVVRMGRTALEESG